MTRRVTQHIDKKGVPVRTDGNTFKGVDDLLYGERRVPFLAPVIEALFQPTLPARGATAKVHKYS